MSAPSRFPPSWAADFLPLAAIFTPHYMEDNRNGMLTLARREGESIILTIEGMVPIRIMLSTVDKPRPQARIAIEAPEEVGIWREELLNEETG